MGRWSGMAALGDLANGAGQFFGQLNGQKIRTERLAQARAEKLADRAHAEQRADDKAAVAQEHELLDEMGAEVSTEAQRKRAMLETKKSNAEKDSEWRSRQDYSAKLAEKKSIKDAERKATADSLTAGGTTGEKKTASQVTHETRTQQAEYAMQELETLMETYDPGSAKGGWDQVMTGGLTNFLASEEGKQYQSAAGRAKEAFLRAATGAAAPETENKSYINMFIPQFGDGPETKKAKLAAMREQISIMQSAYGDDIPMDVKLARFEENAVKMAEKYNIRDTSPEALADEKRQIQEDFEPYQDERGNWIMIPPKEATVDDLMSKYLK